MRHIDTALLWIQDRVLKKQIILHKIDGTHNIADIFTKYLGSPDMRRHLEKMNFRFRNDRADAALEILHQLD